MGKRAIEREHGARFARSKGGIGLRGGKKKLEVHARAEKTKIIS